MDGTATLSGPKRVFDRDNDLVGTLPGEDEPGGSGNLEVRLAPAVRRRLDVDRDRIEVPAREIAAIRRDGIRLASTLRELQVRPVGSP